MLGGDLEIAWSRQFLRLFFLFFELVSGFHFLIIK